MKNLNFNFQGKVARCRIAIRPYLHWGFKSQYSANFAPLFRLFKSPE